MKARIATSNPEISISNPMDFYEAIIPCCWKSAEERNASAEFTLFDLELSIEFSKTKLDLPFRVSGFWC